MWQRHHNDKVNHAKPHANLANTVVMNRAACDSGATMVCNIVTMIIFAMARSHQLTRSRVSLSAFTRQGWNSVEASSWMSRPWRSYRIVSGLIKQVVSIDNSLLCFVHRCYLCGLTNAGETHSTVNKLLNYNVTNCPLDDYLVSSGKEIQCFLYQNVFFPSM